MTGPKEHIAGGNSRDVFSIDYEGEQLVLKVVKHHTDRGVTRHLMEAIALDVVRDQYLTRRFFGGLFVSLTIYW